MVEKETILTLLNNDGMLTKPVKVHVSMPISGNKYWNGFFLDTVPTSYGTKYRFLHWESIGRYLTGKSYKSTIIDHKNIVSVTPIPF